MDTYRSLLEVLKWLSAKDVLCEKAAVSEHWSHTSESNELWQSLLDSHHPSSPLDLSAYSPPKLVFQHLLKSRYIPLLLPQSIPRWDLTRKQWLPPVQLTEPIVTSDPSIACLPGGDLVLAGGYYTPGRCYAGETYAIYDYSTVKRWPALILPRCRHGIVSFRGTIFVFGGRSKLGNLRAFEKLPKNSLFWSASGEMAEIRVFFTPCVLDFRVYLCGGGTNTIESFDPPSEQFTTVPVSIPYYSQNYACVYERRIYLFGPVGYSVVRVETGEVDSGEVRDYQEMWAGGYAVGVDGGMCVAVAGERKIFRVDWPGGVISTYQYHYQ